ncbi:MAG: hypothetical protein ACRD2F_12295, partial [Terriglobales bacterium]
HGLSQAVGAEGFATLYRRRREGRLEGPPVAVDFTANIQSLGVPAVRARDYAELEQALARARAASGPAAVVVATALEPQVGSYESWWDVPVAEVAQTRSAQAAHAAYAPQRARERAHLGPPPGSSASPAAPPADHPVPDHPALDQPALDQPAPGQPTPAAGGLPRRG